MANEATPHRADRGTSRRTTNAGDTAPPAEIIEDPMPNIGDLLNRDITDPASFNRDTSDARAVAGLYFYKEIDCLVDLAHGVSLDFFDRPQLYRDVQEPVVSTLAELRARYGYQETTLSREQRQEIFAGVFGADDGGGSLFPGTAAGTDYSFGMLRDPLLAAAVAFAERVFSTSEDLLRATVRIMHVYFKDYLQDVDGASVRWSRTIGLPEIAEKSYQVLHDPQIAARFAVDKPPRPEWPFQADANGGKLVEQISIASVRGAMSPMTRAGFADKQQLALRGAEALATIIDYRGQTDADSVDLLIRKCYAWYAAQGRVLQFPVSYSRQPSPTGPAPVPPESNRNLFGTEFSAIPRAIS
jgi:hypothetical protein